MRREDVYPGKDSSRDDPALAALDARDKHEDATKEEEDGGIAKKLTATKLKMVD